MTERRQETAPRGTDGTMAPAQSDQGPQGMNNGASNGAESSEDTSQQAPQATNGSASNGAQSTDDGSNQSAAPDSAAASDPGSANAEDQSNPPADTATADNSGDAGSNSSGSSGGGGLAGDAGDLMMTADGLIHDVRQTAETAAASGVDAASGLLGNVVAEGLTDDVVGTAGGLAANATGGGNGLIGSVVNTTDGLVAQTVNATDGLLHDVIDAAGGLAGSATDSANGLVGSVINTADGLVGQTANATDGLLHDVVDAADGLAGSATSGATGLVGDAANGGNGLIGDVTGAVGSVGDTTGTGGLINDAVAAANGGFTGNLAADTGPNGSDATILASLTDDGGTGNLTNDVTGPVASDLSGTGITGGDGPIASASVMPDGAANGAIDNGATVSLNNPSQSEPLVAVNADSNGETGSSNNLVDTDTGQQSAAPNAVANLFSSGDASSNVTGNIIDVGPDGQTLADANVLTSPDQFQFASLGGTGSDSLVGALNDTATPVTGDTGLPAITAPVIAPDQPIVDVALDGSADSGQQDLLNTHQPVGIV